jgi:hypothetical protein
MVNRLGDVVLGPAEIEHLVSEAHRVGLRPLCQPDLEVNAALIDEQGLRYTFLTLAFERQLGAEGAD